MRRMAVNDQEDWALGVLYQAAAEINEDVRCDPTFGDHEAHQAFRRNGRDHIAIYTLAGAGNDWGISLRCPGCACMIVGAHTRLIAEEDCRAGLLGQCLDLGEFNAYPRFSAFRFLLARTRHRSLRVQAYPTQQTGYRAEPQT